jgi:alpha-glucosidase
MVNHYRDTIRRAARHHLIMEAHEMVKDTGERRTYPNIMTREAVRGMEWEAWSEGNPPEHLVDIPFTRMIAGPMSYTPGIFDVTWDPGGPGRPPWRTLEHTRVHSTRAAQLALYPVYLSGLQMMADIPEHYEGQPELEFLERVPTT